ncbi:hypothetical protein DH2020_011712 [Rehmannia glutinosa]|uniref:Peptidase A1 domain-containing protein n=1 Tax=Rehmannia glutinosa TaxID=99300 RepID=A0ABR0XE99_REHGL
MTEKLHSLLFLSLFLVLLPHYQCTFSSESNGFSLKLSDYLQKSTRKFGKEESITDHFPDVIRPWITRATFIFTIEASIGTPKSKKALIFDPGSQLTWTQCTPCINCFQQNYPLFDPKKSRSYKKLAQNHPFARFFRRANNGDLSFNASYGSGQSSTGIASVETFSFPSHKRASESINGFVFGCGNNQQGYFINSVTGVMGMNRSPLSFISQMNSTSAQKFSYCLPPINSPVKTTRLRFGQDVKETGNLQQTSFLNNIDYSYRVNLLDISINGHRLNLPNGTFPRGCILDTGCAASRIEGRAYDEVLRVLMQYFSRYNLTRVAAGPNYQGELCYVLRRGFRNFPNMIFHFQGANFMINPENLFHVMNDRFCLALFRDDKTILGPYQQQNVRFIYDIGNQKLLFGREDCSQDSA